MKSVTERVYYKDFTLALVGYFLFVCQDTVSKDLVTRYHVTQIVFFSSIAALMTVVIYTHWKNAWQKMGIVPSWSFVVMFKNPEKYMHNTVKKLFHKKIDIVCRF